MSPEFAAAAACSPDPAAAEQAFHRIAASWPADASPLQETLASFGPALPAFFHLLAVSPISAQKIVRDPAALAWLATPSIHASDRGPRRMRAALHDLGWQQPAATTNLKPQAFRPLRLWKQRESLRIAFRDVAGLAAVEETTLELTHLAEICVREVTTAWMQDQSRRLGDPGADLCVLAMGKFGAQELNFSSDIDLIFFYGDPGELPSGLSKQEFFTRVAQRIVETFAATDPAGALFRIDLRLRPEGDGGPLVRTLDGIENYYAAFGETWERMALSKARLVAGDEELGYEFFQRLQSFIYPRAVSHDMIEEVAHLKRRIENELLGPSRVHRDVKLGRGGIREVEFVCQTLQLLHGARHAFLQERQTFKALQALCQLDYLGAPEAATLAEAYRFLRNVEHRLQIENEAQTHTLPDQRPSLRRIARSLALSADATTSSDTDECTFLATLIRHMDGVREVFDRVMQVENGAPVPAPDLSFFLDANAARKNLADLGEGGGRALISPRTKRLFARLEPLLLTQLRTVADPDATLTRLVRFTERYGSRGALFDALLVNPRVLELLVKLFDASAFLSEIAIKRPQLVEEVARLGDLGESLDASAHLAGLERNEERLPWEAWVRVYRRSQQLRIALRDLLGFAELSQVWAECTALAEACLIYTARQLGLTEALTIIALGKFGGNELGYGADLDVLFLGRDSAAAGQLIRAMTETTAEGRVFPVDARLRPEGEGGALVLTLEEWRDYFARGRGQLWEAQALSKARPILGPDQSEWLDAAQRVWREHGRRPDLFDGIKAMLLRVAEHRGSDPMLDFKTGPGGLVQLEFYVQAQQMRLGLWEPNTLRALARTVSSNKREPLRDAYLFLRQIETVLRRMEDTSVSKLPADPVEQHRLGQRCRLSTSAALLEKVGTARATIARFARLSPS